MLPAAQPHCLDAVLTPTHRSPISRMLLRYRWQSCSTWGQKDGQWAGMASPKGEGTDTRTEPYPSTLQRELWVLSAGEMQAY